MRPIKYSALNKTSHIVKAALMILALSFGSTALSEESGDTKTTRDAMGYFFDKSFGFLNEELEQAKTEGKRGLFVMFSDPECPWCEKMKSTVLNQIAVQDLYRKYFRILHIDIRGSTPIVDFSGKEMTEKEFSEKTHRVRATPVFIFFDLNGQPISRYTGATRSPEEFMWLGEFVVSGAYKTTNFIMYKRERLSTTRQSR